MSRLWLIVPSAGQGSRMQAKRPKQYLVLDDRPVLAHTLARLHQAFPEAHLCLCLAEHDAWFDPAWVPFAKWRRISGGLERVDSVRNALREMTDEAEDDDWVLVHDVARPCVTRDDLLALYAALSDEPVGALLAAPVADTMKRADETGRIRHTESREHLWHALTPQGFRYGLLKKALLHAPPSDNGITDEASSVEALGLEPRLVEGRRDNLKITRPEDLPLAGHILAAQRDNESEQEEKH